MAKPEAEIFKYYGQARWGIDTRERPRMYRVLTRWETCPGFLWQTYHTRGEAEMVAQWWGYTVTGRKTRIGWKVKLIKAAWILAAVFMTFVELWMLWLLR